MNYHCDSLDEIPVLCLCVLRTLAALGIQLDLLVERRISCKDPSKACLRLWTDIKPSLCIVLRSCDQPLKPCNGRRLRDGQGQCAPKAHGRMQGVTGDSCYKNS